MMRRAVLADTGPLYATLDPRDDKFEQAREDVSRLNSERLSVAVSFPVLCESYSLVLYKLGIESAQGWLKEVRGQASLVDPEARDHVLAADLISGYRSGLTTTTSTLCGSRSGGTPDMRGGI